jgi:hypothetical protein
MFPGNVLARAEGATLFTPAARTATANGTGVDVTDFEGVAFALLTSAAGTGTSPTLDVKLQDSDDNSTFADISGATFTQVTNAAASQQLKAIDLSAARKFVRAVATIAGTSPSFTCAVALVGIKKYPSA